MTQVSEVVDITTVEGARWVTEQGKKYPDLWIENYLGCDMWALPKLIARSTFANKRTVVASCSATSKSHSAARIAIAFLYLYSPSTVITTAPTFRQVQDILWREIGAAWRGAKVNLGGDLKSVGIQIREDWFAIGLSTDEPEKFQGLHNINVLVIGDEACFDDETEVLTRQGWKLIKDIDKSDTILTASTETWQAHYRKPKAIMEYQHNGEMYEIEQRGCSLKITPQHKCLVSVNQDYKTNKWQLKEIQNLTARSSFYMKRDFKWAGSNRKTFKFPFTRLSRLRFSRKFVDIGDWSELLGWILSEGNIFGNRGVDYGVTITQHSKDNQRKIVDIANRLGFKTSVYLKEVKIQSAQLARVIKDYGSSSLNKYVPDYIKELPPEHISRFLDSYFAGDGYPKSGRRIFYTSSKCMADDLQELILKTGKYASIQKRTIEGQRKWIIDHYATSSTDGYVVAEYKDNTLIKVRRKNIKRVNYVGKVYCVDLPPYHLLYVRRNGTCMWSGNSGLTPAVYTAIENPLASGNAHLLLIGNPTQPVGDFKDAFNSPLYKTFYISCFDTPNFTHFGIVMDDIRHNKWQEKIGDNDLPRPYLISPQWVWERYEEWGENNILFQVYCLGQFPDAGVNTLIPVHSIDYAMNTVKIEPKGEKVASLDVSRYGDDESVYMKRQGNKVFPPISWGHQDNIYSAGRTARSLRDDKPLICRIDAVGTGSGTYDILKDNGFDNIEEYNGAEPALDTEIFANSRAEIYFKVANMLQAGEIDLPSNTKLRSQLADIRYKYNKKNQLLIESKEEARSRGVKSPDYADALIMLFKPVKASLRNKQRVRSFMG